MKTKLTTCLLALCLSLTLVGAGYAGDGSCEKKKSCGKKEAGKTGEQCVAAPESCEKKKSCGKKETGKTGEQCVAGAEACEEEASAADHPWANSLATTNHTDDAGYQDVQPTECGDANDTPCSCPEAEFTLLPPVEV